MKIKKLSVAGILLALTIIAYILASVLFAYTTKPEIENGEFPFSIIYEYKGEIKTLSGVFECEYSGSGTVYGEHNRYWNGVTRFDNTQNAEDPHIVDQNDEMQTTLAIHENMHAGYFMGDPLYKDYYANYGLEGAEPDVEYYDYKNDISLNEENREEVLESIGFKIIAFTYAEPIENSFSFSGVRYKADNVSLFILILLVFFILCLILVRKDSEYQYTKLDKIGVIMNFVVGILALPFICFACILFGIVGSNSEFVEQLIYTVPPISILCLALSVVFRRKGISRTGFFVQFGGVALFVLALILDSII